MLGILYDAVYMYNMSIVIILCNIYIYVIVICRYTIFTLTNDYLYDVYDMSEEVCVLLPNII